MTLEGVLLLMNVAIGAITLISAAKSAYNGHVRRLIDNIHSIEDVDREVRAVRKDVHKLGEDLEDTQDAVVGVSYAMKYDDMDMDPENVERTLGDDDGMGRFHKSRNRGFVTGPEDGRPDRTD